MTTHKAGRPLDNEEFVLRMVALESSLTGKLPEDKHLIRLMELPEPMSYYATLGSGVYQPLTPVEYLHTLQNALCAFKERVREIAFEKYRRNPEARPLFTNEGKNFMKVLISRDANLGLLINVKLFDGSSMQIPTAKDGAHQLQINDDKLRTFRCISAHYVHKDKLQEARAQDPEMKKLYMSFEQLNEDITILNLFQELYYLLWEGNEYTEKGYKHFLYDKTV